MYYYRVWVASTVYRRAEPLVYKFSGKLTRGQVVRISVQNKKTLGIIEGPTKKPPFVAKEIDSAVSEACIPEEIFKLVEWIASYYPSSLGNVLALFLPSSLLTSGRLKKDAGLRCWPEITSPSDQPFASKTGAGSVRRTAGTPPSPEPVLVRESSGQLGEVISGQHLSKQPELQVEQLLPDLTLEQKQALAAINSNPVSSFLLHGETGSGKTRLYLECAKKSFIEERSVLILTPEIGLTSQLANIFEAIFGQRVIVFHSMLTPAERRDIWLRILGNQKPLVIIGPRSAMFTPIAKIGLIVMDEAHETSYKQDQAPNYQTSRVAAKLASFHGASFIMGTATPLVVDYYAYEQKNLPIIRLSQMAIKDAQPAAIEVVRLNNRDQFSKSPYISDPLRQAIEDALRSGEQSLIYLNRRGTARITLCTQCHWQALCPQCDVPLTYHGDLHELRCHICGHKAPAPSCCPECFNTDITFRSIGTKSLASELTRLFPDARLQRFDTDNAKADRLENTLKDIKARDVDIMVGTQLLGKGLDLPYLSVVGVVQADTSLQIPDYTADETTYQQLVQIIGRVGRGHRAGKVFIQSHNPDNPAIQAAINNGGYKKFYESQLEERQRFEFPPFVYILKLSCNRASPESAKKASEKLVPNLLEMNLPIKILGPSPAFHGKKAGQYYYQIIIKAKQRSPLLEIAKQLPSGWSYDIDPANLL